MAIYLYLFLSALGFLDSLYLTIQHYNRDPFNCPIFNGCEQVTTSIYSEIFGIPLALLGSLFYGTIFILTLISFLNENKKLFYYVGFLSIAGLLCTMYLVFLMLFVINALCFYCLVSATTSTLLFIIFIVNWLSWKKRASQSAKDKS
jgi:uncharacterized membrane protein